MARDISTVSINPQSLPATATRGRGVVIRLRPTYRTLYKLFLTQIWINIHLPLQTAILPRLAAVALLPLSNMWSSQLLSARECGVIIYRNPWTLHSPGSLVLTAMHAQEPIIRHQRVTWDLVWCSSLFSLRASYVLYVQATIPRLRHKTYRLQHLTSVKATTRSSWLNSCPLIRSIPFQNTPIPISHWSSCIVLLAGQDGDLTLYRGPAARRCIRWLINNNECHPFSEYI